LTKKNTVENNNGKQNGFYSKKLKAGKRRTYFFDVRDTRQGDYFVTITETKKRHDGDGVETHKIFLYKEDFKRFVEALHDTVNHIKTELLPDFDYDADRPVRTDKEESTQASTTGRPNKNTSYLDNPSPAYKAPAASTNQLSDEDIKPASGGVISDDEQIEW
jgi:Protein of unknown function (DUF3276)